MKSAYQELIESASRVSAMWKARKRDSRIRSPSASRNLQGALTRREDEFTQALEIIGNPNVY